ncbi:VOC family protein [Xanthovirga aplysinae]|uniref:VOC family protein n=1 Tax=Xanthovirga aplysinae TaxID=2529853 RepID=UPI0012BCFF21|nr:VOC family protein [Xanthovirga aplysinae]MTI30128.1 hypothetical protein [Xanthovirga aplysinae]
MNIELDHTIVSVADVPKSIAFYTDIMGFHYEGEIGPFHVIRINDHLVFDLRKSEKVLPEHYAFSMPKGDFEEVRRRWIASNILFGNSPFDQENKGEPKRWQGAKGETWALYAKDPDKHSIEIRTYE